MRSKIYIIYTCAGHDCLRGEEALVYNPNDKEIILHRDGTETTGLVRSIRPTLDRLLENSARGRRGGSGRSLGFLRLHLEVLLLLLFQNDGLDASLLVVYPSTGGSFGIFLGVRTELELLESSSCSS